MREGAKKSFLKSEKPITSVKYDGASVNSRKKNSNLFSPPFFSKNSRKNKFKFIFSNGFPKTAEKIYLNIFSPTFFQKQQKKYI